MRDVFGILCTCFFVLGGDFIFDWLELVELFRLYLGASLCILSFSSCFFLLGYTC